MMLVVTGLALSQPASAHSLNCSGSIIQRGDSIHQVYQRCPEPFWTERWQLPVTVGGTRRSPLYSTDTIETWYLNFGSRRLMRMLVFRNGYLERIDQLGYGVGFRPGSRQCAAQALRTAGETSGEIWARCGEPTHRYEFPVVTGGYQGGPWSSAQQQHQEIWTYEFGGRQHARELTFRNGRLIGLRSLTR